MEQPTTITKLEWVSCPWCATTFQVAVPFQAKRMKVLETPLEYSSFYTLRMKCPSKDCLLPFWIETDLDQYSLKGGS